MQRRVCRSLGVPVSVFQGGDVGQGEVWLVLTDPSLQEEKEEKPERPCRRTAALCVSTSCVLTSSVVRALKSSAACHASFRDVIKEHGRSLQQITEITLASTVSTRAASDPTKCASSTSTQPFGFILFLFLHQRTE